MVTRVVGPSAWIVIEKILAVDEALEPTLPVGGTTGYDVLREVGGLFVDPQGAPALTALVESSGVDYRALPEMLADLKIRSATDTLGSELSRLRRSIAAAAGADHPQLPAAVAALLTTSGSTAATTPAWSRCCPPPWPKPRRPHRNWARRCRCWPRRWPAAASRPPGYSSCAGPSPQSLSRTACSIATPGWYR